MYLKSSIQILQRSEILKKKNINIQNPKQSKRLSFLQRVAIDIFYWWQCRNLPMWLCLYEWKLQIYYDDQYQFEFTNWYLRQYHISFGTSFRNRMDIQIKIDVSDIFFF